MTDSLCDFWNRFGAISEDNCKLWTHHSSNPVMPASGDLWRHRWTANPDILKFQGRTLIYYRGNGILPNAPGEQKDRIGVSELISITRDGLEIRDLNDGEPVIDCGCPGEFDFGCVLDPAAIVFDGKVYLYYSALNNDSRESIGLAVSDDGVKFSKVGSVISGRAPEVVNINGRIGLIFQRHPEISSPYDVHLAYSDDGIHFDPIYSEPILTKTPGTWDGFSAVTCRVEYDGDYYYMLYGGSSTRADEPEYFGLARSKDLIHWDRHPGNPIFSVGAAGSPDGGAIWFPAILWDEDSFYLLYEGSAGKYGEGCTSQICMSWMHRR